MKIFYGQITNFGGLVFYLFVLFLLFFFNQYDLLKYLSVSLAFVMIISYAIKLIYFRERPDRQKAKSIIMRLDASSFPSIHTMRIFSLVFWFSLFYREKFFIVFLTAIAIMVMYSRIYLKRHHLSDIAGGLAISAVINSAIWWFM